ncbi:MAG TPA: hypothetical protein VJ439_03085 [Candidatus Bathyarchaeia archaeon]|jgi:hypothetical protein|nr:hypothetical protein [Candidatus Bathyarchaeia archaeon]
MANDVWCVVVFKCEPKSLTKTLVEFYDFIRDIEGVKSLHFLIRDRVGKEVVFSFRVLVDGEKKKAVESKMVYKLGTLISEVKFAINPDQKSSFRKFVAWQPEEMIAKLGGKKFSELCHFLSMLSKLVVQMARKKYFDSSERVEMAHLVSWMLGCTEYGRMSPNHWEVGYWDRIEDRYHQYLRQDFPKTPVE